MADNTLATTLNRQVTAPLTLPSIPTLKDYPSDQKITELGEQLTTERRALAESQAEEARQKGVIAGQEAKLPETILGPIYQKREEELQKLKDQEIPFKPTQENAGDMALIFTLVGMVGSALGGIGAKNSAIGAQNAMSGMLKAYREGREDTYKKEYQQYKDNLELLRKKSEDTLRLFETYEKEAINIGIPAAKAELEAGLAAIGADVIKHTANVATIKDAYDSAKSVYDMTLKAIQRDNKLKQDTFDMQLKAFEAQSKAYEASQKALGGLTDEAATLAAEQYLVTGKHPFMYGDKESKAKVQNTAARLAYQRGLSGQDLAGISAGFVSDQASLRNVQKQRDTSAAYERSMETNMQIAEKVGLDALKSAFPLLNKWYQTGSTALGGVSAPKYAVALLTVADQYAKILSGSTGAAAASDTSRAQAIDKINQAFNEGQISGVFDVMRWEAKGRIKGYDDLIKEIKGRMSGSVPGPRVPFAPAAVAPTPSAPSAGAPTTTVGWHQDRKGNQAYWDGKKWLDKPNGTPLEIEGGK